MEDGAGGEVAEGQQPPGDAPDSHHREAEQREGPLLRASPPPPPPQGHRHRRQQQQSQRREEVEEDDRTDLAQGVGQLAGADVVSGPVERFQGRAATDHGDEVLALVVDRAVEAGFAVGVDDRLHRPPLVDFGHPRQRPLQEAVARRLVVFLVGRPGRHDDDRDQRRDPDPAPAGEAADGGDQGQRDHPEHARSVPHHRQRHQQPQQHRRPPVGAGLVPQRRDHQRRSGEQHRRRQQLRPDEEAVDDRQAAEEDGDDDQGPRRPPQPRRRQQRPETDDPELLQDDAEHLVVERLQADPEGPLGENEADLQRGPVAGEPVRRVDRVAGVAVGVEPLREEPGQVVVGGKRPVEPAGRGLDGIGDVAVDEAEEDEEGGAEPPERQRRGELPQQPPVDPPPLERPADQHYRAEEEEEGEALANRAVRVVGPEGAHRRRPGSRQRDRQQNRHLADPEPRAVEARSHPRQRRQDQVEREQQK